MAKALFWKYGIRKVSVEEICREAQVSKMTFYRNFKNKNDVAEKVIDHLLKVAIEQYDEIMHADLSFEQKVRALIQLKYEAVMNISHEFVQDIYQNNEANLRARFDNYRETQLKVVMRDFKKAQSQGWIRKDLKLEFILYMLGDLNTKLLDKQLNTYYENEDELIMELTNFFFYGIMP